MPILPKHRDLVSGELPEDPATTPGIGGRWIPASDVRMLVDDPQAIRRRVAAAGFLDRGAAIEFVDAGPEPG